MLFSKILLTYIGLAYLSDAIKHSQFKVLQYVLSLVGLQNIIVMLFFIRVLCVLTIHDPKAPQWLHSTVSDHEYPLLALINRSLSENMKEQTLLS